MNKASKRIFSFLAATLALSICCGAAARAAVDMKRLSGNVIKVEGTVKLVEPFYGANGEVSENSYFLFMTTKTENGEAGEVSFYIDENTDLDIGAGLKPGMSVAAYYNGDLPVILIYPPRYNALAVEVIESTESAAEAALPEAEPENALPPDEPAVEQAEEIPAAAPGIVINEKEIDAEYFIDDDGVIMLPARAVCEALGHEVRWDGSVKRVEIGNLYSFTIGRNAYNFARVAPIELEKAPVVQDGVTYVPMSFFSDVMHLECTYTIEGPATLNAGETAE